MADILLAKKISTSFQLYPEVSDGLTEWSRTHTDKSKAVNTAILMFLAAPREEKDRFLAIVGNLKKGVPLEEIQEEQLEDAVRRLQIALKVKKR